MVTRWPVQGGARLLALFGSSPRGVWPATGPTWVPPPDRQSGRPPNAVWRCSRCQDCLAWTLRLETTAPLGVGDVVVAEPSPSLLGGGESGPL
eukprot:11809859-Alexandrium_andersonii.AAC.1